MRALAISTTVLIAVLCPACAPTSAQPTEYHETFTFPAQSGKVVSLELRSLDSLIEVVEGDTITVSVDLEARSSSRRAAQRWVEARTPTVNDSPARLEVKVPSKGARVSVFGYFHSHDEVRVTLPASCRLEIRNTSGDIRIDGDVPLEGVVKIDTTSGDVTVRGGVSELVVDTTSGDVSISREALASLEAETASGDVRVEDGAQRVLVETSSGDVTLRALTGELVAATSSGDVRASWERLEGSTLIRTDTGSGDVTLRLPGSVALGGELRTTGGDIQSSFEGELDRRGRRFRITPPSVPAELDPDGSSAAPVVLEVRTSSGDITVSRRAG